MYEVMLMCINSPLYYAVYKDRKLAFDAKIDGKTLDALYQMQCGLKQKNIEIKTIYYARGPGNLSALKLTHTFLHTLAVVENVELKACDSFDLLCNSLEEGLGEVAIFAYGKRYFIKRGGEIKCVFLENLDKELDSSDIVDNADVNVAKSSLIKESSLDVNEAKSKKTKKHISTAKSFVVFDSSVDFRFPHKLDIALFTSPCEPLYVLPPV